MCPPVIFTFILYVTFPSFSIHFLLKYCKMPRCGRAHAELMHMHEVELLPLGDTDVTTLGKWLSNHDNMAQCCILLGRALWMASTSSRQDSDIPSARSTVSGWWQPASGNRGPSTLASIWPLHPTLVPGGAVYDLPDWVLQLRRNGRPSQMATIRDAKIYSPWSCKFGSEFRSLSISSTLTRCHWR